MLTSAIMSKSVEDGGSSAGIGNTTSNITKNEQNLFEEDDEFEEFPTEGRHIHVYILL